MPRLWRDAACIKVHKGGRIIRRAVMVAVAVNEGGKREVLGVAASLSEAETFSTEFLRSPADRGLRGAKLVVADDHKGRRAAARRVFDAAHQRCRVGLLKKPFEAGSMSWAVHGMWHARTEGTRSA